MNFWNIANFWNSIRHSNSNKIIKHKNMRDKISIDRINKIHPKLRDEAKQIIINAESRFPDNMCIRIAQGLRTFEEQDALYRKRPKVTNAKAGQSLHNYGLALDFVIMVDKDKNGTYEEVSWDIVRDYDGDGTPDWNEVVEEFKKLGWEWGGNWRTFKDYPHVQKPFGNTWRTLLDKYNKKNFIPGTKYVNI